jgi:hypothetical protein
MSRRFTRDPALRRTPALLLVLTAWSLGTGCGTSNQPALSWTQVDPLSQEVRRRLVEDPELAGLVRHVGNGTRDVKQPIVILQVYREPWTALPRPDRDRLMRKVAVALTDACRPFDPTYGAPCLLHLLDDRNAIQGWAVAGGSNRPYQYELR